MAPDSKSVKVIPVDQTSVSMPSNIFKDLIAIYDTLVDKMDAECGNLWRPNMKKVCMWVYV